MNKASDEHPLPTFPQGYSEFAFNGVSLYVRMDELAIIKQRINELRARQPEAYTIELEEKLLVTENALHEANDKLERLERTLKIQTDRIERLENAVRTLAPYEQFFHTITSLLRLPAFTSTRIPTPNGNTNV